MGKLSENQLEIEEAEEYNRLLAEKNSKERAARKASQIANARSTFDAHKIEYRELNKGYHFRVGNYDYYPTTSRFKHVYWKEIRGHGIKQLIQLIGKDKVDKVVYTFCGNCKAKFPHRASENPLRCNACINKANAAEQRQRLARMEAERIAARDAEATVVKMEADWDNPCSTCGQTPIIKGFDICAVCTFGEADAQQELIDGDL